MSIPGDLNNDGTPNTVADLVYLASNMNNTNSDTVIDASDVENLANSLMGNTEMESVSNFTTTRNMNFTSNKLDGSGSVVELNLQSEHLPSNKRFNKVRLMRTTENSSSDNNYITVRELQIWVYVNNVLTNVAYDSTSTTAQSLSSFDVNSGPSNVNNGVIEYQIDSNNFSPTWQFKSGDPPSLGDWVQVPFNDGTSASLNDLACIVIYWNYTAPERVLGVSVQLMLDDTIIFTKEMARMCPWVRFDGPAISRVLDHSYSLIESNDKIIAKTSKITKFNRTPLSKHGTFKSVKILFNEDKSIDSYMNILELQVWVYIDDVLTNVASSDNGGTVTVVGEYFDDYPPSGAINNKISNQDKSLFYTRGNDTTDPYLQVNMANSVLINDLASIVIYPEFVFQSINPDGNWWRMIGNSVQIIDEYGNIIKQVYITAATRIFYASVGPQYRIDGPSISRVSSFATSPSTTQIIDKSAYASLYSGNTLIGDFYTIILEQLGYWAPTHNLKKLRVYRKRPNTYQLYSDNWNKADHLTINEIQVWKYSNNTITNIASTSDASTNSLYSSLYAANNVIDGDISTRWASQETGSEIRWLGGKEYYIELDFSESIPLSQLASIVIYPYGRYNNNSCIQLFDDNDNLIYEKEIVAYAGGVYRIDGPAIKQVIELEESNTFFSDTATTSVLDASRIVSYQSKGSGSSVFLDYIYYADDDNVFNQINFYNRQANYWCLNQVEVWGKYWNYGIRSVVKGKELGFINYTNNDNLPWSNDYNITNANGNGSGENDVTNGWWNYGYRSSGSSSSATDFSSADTVNLSIKHNPMFLSQLASIVIHNIDNVSGNNMFVYSKRWAEENISTFFYLEYNDIIVHQFEFNYEIINNHFYNKNISTYRFDGPSINDVPMERFTTENGNSIPYSYGTSKDSYRIYTLEYGFEDKINVNPKASISIDDINGYENNCGTMNFKVNNNNNDPENILSLHGDGTVEFNTKSFIYDTNFGKIRMKDNFIYFGANGITDKREESSCYIGRGEGIGTDTTGGAAHNKGDLLITNGADGTNDILIWSGDAESNMNTTGDDAIGEVIIDNMQDRSDNRLKHNETLITNALDSIRQLKGYRYWKTLKMYDENHNFNLDASGFPVNENNDRIGCRLEDGFIAQDLLNIDNFQPFVSKKNDGNSPYVVKYNSLFVNTTAALQDLDKLHSSTANALSENSSRLDVLENEYNKYDSQINDILSRLSVLENN